MSVIDPESTGDERAGREAYNKNCANCHGAHAEGQDGVAPPLVHKIHGALQRLKVSSGIGIRPSLATPASFSGPVAFIERVVPVN